ncbi:hypothetical protein ACFVAJ_10335 [Agromyces sp. NPDC057679]|uniref:hypothetical protein n=1 Tax=Agromyces sp. NPDC057679 TaxID=3346207 RepID=UPI00366C1B45
MAWRLFEAETPDPAPPKAVGLRYRSTDRATGTLVYVGTEPRTDAARAEFGQALLRAGVRAERSVEPTLAEAVANSVAGVRAEKGGSQSASPLTPALALLQNLRGLQGAKNPPDFAEIIERMYILGGGRAEDRSAAEMWLQASELRMHLDPLLASIDRAIDEQLVVGRRVRRPIPEIARKQDDHLFLAGTPFSWFRRSWDLLCDRVWVEALPARVWVDWATTLLRLAVGLGFLWESSWNESLARRVVSPGGERITQVDVLRGMDTVLPWRSSRLGVQGRDIAGLLNRRIARSELVRRAVMAWHDDLSVVDGQVFDSIAPQMREDSNLRQQLGEALIGRDSNSASNVREAVRYALRVREAAGPFADYYGVLRQNGRYLTVDPGTEWIAVVASLACGVPGATTDVAAIARDLDEMGLRPELNDLVALLERAGLARGSADADQGVVVESAF